MLNRLKLDTFGSLRMSRTLGPLFVYLSQLLPFLLFSHFFLVPSFGGSRFHSLHTLTPSFVLPFTCSYYDADIAFV